MKTETTTNKVIVDFSLEGKPIFEERRVNVTRIPVPPSDVDNLARLHDEQRRDSSMSAQVKYTRLIDSIAVAAGAEPGKPFRVDWSHPAYPVLELHEPA